MHQASCVTLTSFDPPDETPSGRRLAIPIELLPSTALVSNEDLRRLSSAIAETGLREPIRVARRAGGFTVLDGFRRLAAYRLLAAAAESPAHAARWLRIDALVED